VRLAHPFGLVTALSTDKEALEPIAPATAVGVDIASPPASGDPGVLACAAHELPGVRADVIAVARVDVFDSGADDEGPALPLASGDVWISMSCPSRTTERVVWDPDSAPESGFSVPTCRGVKTNLPTSPGFTTPFDVIATRCFAAAGPADATDVRVTAAASAARTTCRALMCSPSGGVRTSRMLTRTRSR
jgi:hypothetical protein